MATDPTTNTQTHKHTDRTDYNTLRRSLARSVMKHRKDTRRSKLKIIKTIRIKRFQHAHVYLFTSYFNAKIYGKSSQKLMFIIIDYLPNLSNCFKMMSLYN